MSYTLRIETNKTPPLFTARQLSAETNRAWHSLTNTCTDLHLRMSKEGLGIAQDYTFDPTTEEVFRVLMHNQEMTEFTLIYGYDQWTGENRASLSDLKVDKKSDLSALALALAVALAWTINSDVIEDSSGVWTRGDNIVISSDLPLLIIDAAKNPASAVDMLYRKSQKIT